MPSLLELPKKIPSWIDKVRSRWHDFWWYIWDDCKGLAETIALLAFGVLYLVICWALPICIIGGLSIWIGLNTHWAAGVVTAIFFILVARAIINTFNLWWLYSDSHRSRW